MRAQPKYRVVFETLRENILSGKFNAAERFPSEEQLVRRFGVSRNTVRSALEDLKRSGIIETRNGSGTYLSPAAVNTTGTIGLIVPDIATGEIFSRISAEITRVARQRGFSTILGDASSSDPDVRATQVLRLAHDYANRRLDGVILEPPELIPGAERTTRQILSVLEQHHIPIVLIDRDISTDMCRSSYDLVAIDNLLTGYKLAKHLIERGARAIHTLIRPQSAPTLFRRIKGVREAMLDAGLPWRPSFAHEFNPDDENGVHRAFARHVDAVVCGNDLTAARLIGTLSRVGIRVPDDLLVAGVDDVNLATIISPKLTTIRQPCEEIAASAVRLLLDRLSDPDRPAREILLNADLIVRASTSRDAAT